jgi:hypothetical protein
MLAAGNPFRPIEAAMNLPMRFALLGVFASVLVALSLAGQERPKGKGKEPDADAPKVRPLPSDERLLSLHRDFVKKAETLAKEYEGDKDWGRARAVYEEILKLVPQYGPASTKLAEMLSRESSAKVANISVKADAGWQDTGIDLLAGKPVQLAASGAWTFHLEVETNAAGLTIPKELRDFPLGCLIGYVASPGADPKEAKPFVVGSGEPMLLEQGGRLYLRMYDTDPSDNKGALKVEVRGTFEQKK